MQSLKVRARKEGAGAASGLVAVPITAGSPEEALKDIAIANEKADVIELRLDFLEHASETVLEELLAACKKPVIVSFRRLNFGASVEDTERVFILHKAVCMNVALVDLDLNTDRGFLRGIAAGKKNTGIIVSFHDFDGTPPKEKLLNVLEKEINLGADVLKIVTTANSGGDNETVLGLIGEAKKRKKRIIAFCMGEKGIGSRVECLKRGAFLTFASLSAGKGSAPGQIPVDELRKMLGR